MKNFKKMIMGFAAVAMIVGFSAFKKSESKRVDSRYIIGYNSANDTYSFSSTDPGVCNSTPTANPCLITTVDYPALGATGTLPGDDVRDPDKIHQDAWRTSY